MTPAGMQLAELNLGRLLAPTDGPRVADFMAALVSFVRTTVHRQFHDRRAEWFEVLSKMHFGMWWVPAGHRPTLEEALERLAHCQAHGDSDHAFGWSYLKEAQAWKSKACAKDGGVAA